VPDELAQDVTTVGQVADGVLKLLAQGESD
jgi:hypothetical protein